MFKNVIIVVLYEKEYVHMKVNKFPSSGSKRMEQDEQQPPYSCMLVFSSFWQQSLNR